MATEQALPPPNFHGIVTDINTISQAAASLGANIAHIENLPAMDNGVRILNRLDALLNRIDQLEQGTNRRIDQLQTQMNERFDALGHRLDAITESVREYNSIARLENNTCVKTLESPLSALRTPGNEDVEDFPATYEALDRLTGKA
ncbi:hypothetical protein K440DRAFT_641212 [Wilcoxina mikolae CBS 423.85]|nr:hypothetical protein K440DRAFT_641212 [Wilcoxina mikolae CBS 423.85]